MTTLQIPVSDDLVDRIDAMAAGTGKSREALVGEALALLAETDRMRLRRRRFAAAFGLWKDRDDLPDFEALRREEGRGWPGEGGS